jgi:chaperonin GroES
MQLKSGDQVLFTSYAGTEIKVGGEDYIVMEESEILAVIA